MRREVREDGSWSSQRLADTVWPWLQEAIGGGELHVLEFAPQYPVQLDTIAGIDALIVQGVHVFGLASRVQKGEYAKYETFTIRTNRPSGGMTELAKRQSQIATPGSLYARWTCQAYVDGPGQLVSAAVTLTSNVIEAVKIMGDPEKSAYAGERFIPVRWERLAEWDPHLKIFRVRAQ